MIHYLTHPEDNTSDSPSGMDVSELTPVSFMLLTFIGAFFTMTIGGLAGYHWYLIWLAGFLHGQLKLMGTVTIKRHWKTSLTRIHLPLSKIALTTLKDRRAGEGTISSLVLRGSD